jgi:hypothetical protein
MLIIAFCKTELPNFILVNFFLWSKIKKQIEEYLGELITLTYGFIKAIFTKINL